MISTANIPILEKHLSFIWQYGMFDASDLKTVSGKSIRLVQRGTLNQNSGPDFSFCKVEYDGQLWVGNAELHIKTSDWVKHGHQTDAAFGNVVLHVVYEHDKHIPSPGGNIEVLELKQYIFPTVLRRLHSLEQSESLPCSGIYKPIPKEMHHQFIQTYMYDRLLEKSQRIQNLVEEVGGNLQEGIYRWLLLGFGGHLNKVGMEQLGKLLPLSTLLKNQDKPTSVLALIYGVCGFLEDGTKDLESDKLKSEYSFLKEKYQFAEMEVSVWKFSRVRPPGFPTEKLLQFATLIISGVAQVLQNPDGLLDLLKVVSASNQVNKSAGLVGSQKVQGYSFSKDFIKNLDVNTLEPLRLYLLSVGIGNWSLDEACRRWEEYSPENNKVTRLFSKAGFPNTDLAESQAYYYLYQNKCRHKECLHCKFGYQFLKN